MVLREFFEHAIVLRICIFRENDLIVKFLTPSYGVVESFAFGGRKSKKRFLGCFEELSHVVFKVKTSKNGGYSYLQEGILLNRFSNLHRDMSLFGVAVNCQKFLDTVLDGNTYSSDIYDTFLKLLNQLDDCPSITKNVPIFFRARIAGILGYTPRIDCCNSCGRLLKERFPVFFSPSKGQIFCFKCISVKNGYIPLGRHAFFLLRKVLFSGPREWISPQISLKDENNLAHGLKRFVEEHLNIIWQKGRFVRV